MNREALRYVEYDMDAKVMEYEDKERDAALNGEALERVEMFRDMSSLYAQLAKEVKKMWPLEVKKGIFNRNKHNRKRHQNLLVEIPFHYFFLAGVLIGLAFGVGLIGGRKRNG